MNLLIDEIIQRLSEVKRQGFVRSLRKGPTGIGYTLETKLGMKENNISSPDFGEIELKARRESHTGMTTLFTFNKKAWKMNPLEAIKKYGSIDKDGRLGMYYSVKMKPNSAGVFLMVDNGEISARHIDGNVIASWQLSEIKKRFDNKVKNILLVSAKTEERSGFEYFHFDRVRLLSGGTSESILKSQFENEQLIVELRLHDKGTRARNHGTGFRVYENNLQDLYSKIEEVNI